MPAQAVAGHGGTQAAFELQVGQGYCSDATTALLSAVTAMHRFAKFYLKMLLKMTMRPPTTFLNKFRADHQDDSGLTSSPMCPKLRLDFHGIQSKQLIA